MMVCAIYYGPKDIRMEERPDPVCGPKDVVVRNVRAGICGTDLTAYLYSGDPVAIFEGGEFGHEMVGVVETVGSEVEGIQLGDRVFVNPMTCKKEGAGRCDTAGAFSPLVLVENAQYDYNLYRLPEGVSWDEAVLIEPFSVGTHGKNMANTKPEDHVVVYGAGTIGLCALSALVGMGIKDVVVADVNDERLEKAQQLGAVPFNSRTGNLPEFLMQHFGKASSHIGMPVPDVDVFIDCAGARGITNEVLGMAKSGASLSIVAVYKAPDEVNLAGIMSSEITIVGACGYTHRDIQEAIANLGKHRTKIGQIVTHHFPQAKASEGFATASDPSTGSIKIVLDYE